MSMFPYRWLPRTIIPNILYLLRSIRDGVTNVMRWTPVIWGDCDYDWSPLSKIMEYKLRRMSRVFQQGHCVGSSEYAKQTLICAELLAKIQEDESGGVTYHQHRTRMKEWQEMFGRIIGKHLTEWWD